MEVAAVEKTEYLPEGILIDASCLPKEAKRYQEFLIS